MMFERIRVEKRLRILEELVRILLAFVIALLIGIGATATKIYNYESRINELETMQQEGGGQYATPGYYEN